MLSSLLVEQSCLAQESGQQTKAAIQALQHLKPHIQRNRAGQVVLVHLEHREVRNADLKHLRAFSQLKFLYLARTQINDDGLKHLSQLTELRRLSLWGTAITDQGLKHLANLTQLEALDLSRLNLTGKGLEHLHALKHLTFLNLAANEWFEAAELEKLSALPALSSLNLKGVTSATDDALVHIENLRALKNLNVVDAGFSMPRMIDFQEQHPEMEILPTIPTATEYEAILFFLNETSIDSEYLSRRNPLSDQNFTPKKLLIGHARGTDDVLKHLKGLPRLEEILLDAAHLTNNGFLHVANLPQLKSLRIGNQTGKGSKITDAGLAAVSGLTKLEVLELGYPTSLTDEGLKHLQGLQNLRKLAIDGSQVTVKGLAILKDCSKLRYITAWDTPYALDPQNSVLPGVNIETFD